MLYTTSAKNALVRKFFQTKAIKHHLETTGPHS